MKVILTTEDRNTWQVMKLAILDIPVVLNVGDGITFHKKHYIVRNRAYNFDTGEMLLLVD